jgi:Valyl-tRNA synthetase
MLGPKRRLSTTGVVATYVLVEGDVDMKCLLRSALALIEQLVRIESFERAAESPKGAETLTLPGGAVALPMAGVVDGTTERPRLEKALKKVEGEAADLARKLENPGFLAKAPEEVVEENRERLAAAKEEAERLRAAAARAAELV